MPIRLALAPWSCPCSLGATLRLMSPSVAALAMPHSASSGTPARNHSVVVARPKTAKPATPNTSPTIMALVSPRRFTAGPINPPCTTIEQRPTSAITKPTACSLKL